MGESTEQGKTKALVLKMPSLNNFWEGRDYRIGPEFLFVFPDWFGSPMAANKTGKQFCPYASIMVVYSIGNNSA
jgi:hypothetical protein